MTLTVDQQSDAVKAMAESWPIADALLGGTPAMRKAAQAYLPKWPNEDHESYEARRKTATLYPAFERTLGVMAGKPFSKELTFGDDVPEAIRQWCQNCDLEGRNLHSFMADQMAECLGYGIAGVLVDFPRTTGLRTRADEAAAGVRPYLVMIKHAQLLGWRTTRGQDGVTRLTLLRLAEVAEKDDGEYGTKEVQRVRVLRPGSWELWEQGDRAWAKIDEGATTLDVIPYVPFYGRRTGFMTGKSPLLNLAYLNVKHWQSQSDQDTILHVARVPILFTKGFQEGETITVGASAAVRSENDQADMKYVEHTGAAIDAGRQALEDLQDQMIQTGAELLVAQPGERSATEANNDAEANKSELQRIVEGFEDSIDQCLQLMADWARLGEGGHASLYKDFTAATLTDASAQLVLSLQQAGLITKKTAIREQQRRGMLAPDVDPDDELDAVAEEGPSLGSLGTGDGGPAD